MDTDATLRDVAAINTALLVEDNADVAYLLQYMLKRDGYAVQSLSNGRDAKKYIAESRPTDVVILDLMLPYIDGFELLTQIRESSSWRNVPVVVLSGKVSERDIVRAIELGADDFVTKPYKPLELSARIRRCTNDAKWR
ncbi:MAG TPA: response regulator [Burkholderiales bacterium]|nr:response regulator [Burkholderiales bacterium]